MAASSFFASSSIVMTITLVLLVLLVGSSSAESELSTNFYSKSCPKLFSTVKSVVQSAVSNEKRMGASLVRLFFHDCFVNLGGPYWDVKLGRRDSKTASFSEANSGRIPPPNSTLSNLVSRFAAGGLSAKDMVALSGAHTIGQARCTVFRSRIYNETNIDTSFANTRQASCPSSIGSGDDNLATLDLQTPTVFDNKYYKNLKDQKGLLRDKGLKWPLILEYFYIYPENRFWGLLINMV